VRCPEATDGRHDDSQLIVDGLNSDGGYRGVSFKIHPTSADPQSPAPPPADAILVNGVVSFCRLHLTDEKGSCNCSDPIAVPAGSQCSTPEIVEMQVPINKRIRFRIINVGSHGASELLSMTDDQKTTSSRSMGT
jgi:hypothetical protein